MKHLWERPLVHRLLRNQLAIACWKPFSPLWNAAVNRFYRRGICKPVGPYTFRFSADHRRLSTMHYAEEVNWMLQSFRPGQCVFDVGANIGITSLAFAKAVGPTGQVLAFEPSPDSFKSLKNQIHLNQLDSIITPLDYAVTNQPGFLEFWLSEDPYDMQHGPAAGSKDLRRKIEVQAITLDAFCAERQLRPDIIKIDVEGFEPLVLEGAVQLIQNLPDLVFFVELHPWVWSSIGYDDQKVLALFARLGLRAETRDGSPMLTIPSREHVLLSRVRSQIDR